MNNNKKKILSIVAIFLTTLFVLVVAFISYRISSGQGIIPTAPFGSRACNAQCPASSNRSLLISCDPSTDGTYQSLCNAAGRVEICGGVNYCCPSAGGNWTRTMTAACQANISPTATATQPPTATATQSPTATSTVSPTVTATTTPTPSNNQALCQPCGGTSGSCAAGLTCDNTDGRCKSSDGSTVCWEGSAACVTTATAICVPSGTVSCSPDCSTACGQTAKIINTCTNSCGNATTKQCAATNACIGDLTVTNRTFRNETSNAPGNYQYQNEITTVSRNQIFVYEIQIENNSEVDANDISIRNVLTGQNQGLLTYMDAHSNCSFASGTKTLTCTNIDVKAKEKGYVAFRVRVGSNAVNGESIVNRVDATINTETKTANNTLKISTVVGCNQICTQDAECSTGFSCDSDSDRCRRPACTGETDCTCPVTLAASPSVTTTVSPTSTITTSPTGTITGTVTGTTSPTGTASLTPAANLPGTGEGEEEILPETGILDMPGLAAFGGGLLLAIIGILLAL